MFKTKATMFFGLQALGHATSCGLVQFLRSVGRAHQQQPLFRSVGHTLQTTMKTRETTNNNKRVRHRQAAPRTQS
jgi:ATP:corrinoid adenosyltransferase